MAFDKRPTSVGFFFAIKGHTIHSMQIIVTAKKPVLTADHGRLPAGIPVEVPDTLGAFLIGRGDAKRLEVKATLSLPARSFVKVVKAK